MPDAVTENGVVLAPFSVTTVISTEASGSLSHPVISTEASGSERSGEIPQTESDYVHADFSTRPPLAGLVEMTIEKKTATVEMTMVATDKRGYNKAKKKGGAIENRPAP